MRRIYCVGQNYADHAREMGSDPGREPPFFFTKPASALVQSGATVSYPPLTSDLHHEVELVLAIGRRGSNIAVEDAPDYIFGYAVGNDLTRRDLQREAKAARRPWDMAKGFDQSAVVGAIRPAALVERPLRGKIELSVNKAVRQCADLTDMIWSPDEIVAELSRYVELLPGDLIFTGTPAGVGAIVPGETISAEIEGIGELSHAVG